MQFNSLVLDTKEQKLREEFLDWEKTSNTFKCLSEVYSPNILINGNRIVARSSLLNEDKCRIINKYMKTVFNFYRHGNCSSLLKE